jgi:hypothetical protein
VALEEDQRMLAHKPHARRVQLSCLPGFFLTRRKANISAVMRRRFSAYLLRRTGVGPTRQRSTSMLSTIELSAERTSPIPHVNDAYQVTRVVLETLTVVSRRNCRGHCQYVLSSVGVTGSMGASPEKIGSVSFCFYCMSMSRDPKRAWTRARSYAVSPLALSLIPLLPGAFQ